MEAGKTTHPNKIVAVCDTYQKRVNNAQKISGAELGTLDYREVLARKDIDAVIIATPDHWHAPIAIEAMRAGKDVYLEKPMTRTVEEAKRVYEVTKATGRILQVGSQTTSSDQWWKARKAIEDGMIGQLLMSQGSYHRNSIEGEWNWPIDPNAGPDGKGEDYIDWKMWLGNAPKRAFDADRFFRFRKFWDYSGGIATDLFYHVVAPLNICWGEAAVSAQGDRLRRSLRLQGQPRSSGHLPPHRRVPEGPLAGSQLVDGQWPAHPGPYPRPRRNDHDGSGRPLRGARLPHHASLRRSSPRRSLSRSGASTEIQLATETRENHMENWLRCIKTREKPNLDALTAYKAMTTIGMAVQSYREGRVLYFQRSNSSA
jgi:predicted dehydrogenase